MDFDAFQNVFIFKTRFYNGFYQWRFWWRVLFKLVTKKKYTYVNFVWKKYDYTISIYIILTGINVQFIHSCFYGWRWSRILDIGKKLYLHVKSVRKKIVNTALCSRYGSWRLNFCSLFWTNINRMIFFCRSYSHQKQTKYVFKSHY